MFPVTICFHTVERTDKADQDQILAAVSFPRAPEVRFASCPCHVNQDIPGMRRRTLGRFRSKRGLACLDSTVNKT